ncbi:MAG: molybdopterin-guanine dinucleotide biosynthesis protein B [Kiloniellales bacterium]|nr:molybdopterin-guanine dinucleotide biosynthesis protein B [Kiloniellales bacterium]
MKIFGLAGWSGSGKTTLAIKLIPALVARGVSVSTIKHAHHSFDVDHPGKDSYEHRQAGATEVMVTSGERWALMRELRGAAELSIDDLVARMSPVDLVLVEGFKREPHEKLEVFRAALRRPPLCRDDPRIVAIASDEPASPALAALALPRLDLDDVDAIAEFIVARCGLAPAAPEAVS